jgi:nitrate/nitrite transport system substrate-binding protein
MVQIIAQSKYLNTKTQPVESSFLGTYNYGSLDRKNRVKSIPDFYLFHFRDTNYLKEPNHVNYPWLSHGVWLLTQMIRWNHIDLQEYPKDADGILDKIYPLEIYSNAAQALKIKLPSDRMKVEPAEVFIDQHKFDPSQPVEYMNSFDIRA